MQTLKFDVIDSDSKSGAPLPCTITHPIAPPSFCTITHPIAHLRFAKKKGASYTACVCIETEKVGSRILNEHIDSCALRVRVRVRLHVCVWGTAHSNSDEIGSLEATLGEIVGSAHGALEKVRALGVC